MDLVAKVSRIEPQGWISRTKHHGWRREERHGFVSRGIDRSADFESRAEDLPASR